MIQPTKIEAVRELYSQDSFNSCDGNGLVDWKDGHTTTDAEVKAIDDKYKELLAEYDSQAYARKRAEAYPSWQEQMDLIYHSGVAGLKTELKKTKDKFPKE